MSIHHKHTAEAAIQQLEIVADKLEELEVLFQAIIQQADSKRMISGLARSGASISNDLHLFLADYTPSLRGSMELAELCRGAV